MLYSISTNSNSLDWCKTISWPIVFESNLEQHMACACIMYTLQNM